MKKVIGTPSYDIYVTCPNEDCNHYFDIIEQDQTDGDYLATEAMFTNTTESCTNMDLVFVCPKCDEDFILDSLEY